MRLFQDLTRLLRGPCILSQFPPSRNLFMTHPVVTKSALSLRSSFSTSSEYCPTPAKVFELRIYDFHPRSFSEFVKLSREKIGLRTKHSKLLGYWFTEIGGVNQVVHIWEYDSFAHRKSVRAALAADESWQEEYISKLIQCLVKQNNVAMTLLPWSEVEQPPCVDGVYELCAHTMIGSETQWGTKMHDMLMGKEDSHQGTLLGAWKTQAGGSMNTIYHLWHYPDMDNRIQSSEEAAQDPDYVLTKEELLPHCSHYSTKILYPAPWSPMK